MSQRSHLPTAAVDPKQLVALLRESENLELEVVPDNGEPDVEVRAIGTDMSPPIADHHDDLEIPIEPRQEIAASAKRESSLGEANPSTGEPAPRRESSWFASFVLTLLVIAALGAAIWLL